MDNLASDDKKHIVKLAHIYFQAGEWDQALAEYRKILAIDPDDMNAHNTVGDIYLKKGAPSAAYEAYSKAAAGFLSRGQIDKAVQIYKKITKLDAAKISDDDRSKIKLTQNYVAADEALKEDRIEEAIEIFGKILKFRAEDPVVQAKLLELDSKIDQMPVSIQQYQALGDIFLKSDMFKKAQEMFEKIAAIEPGNAAVRSNLAQVYLKQGSENDAKKEYLSIAEEALTKGDLDEAFNFAQKAIELNSVEAHYVSGLVYFKQQKWDQAKEEFVKLLRIKVNHLGALLHLGKSLDLLGQKDKAGEFLNKALKLDKDDSEVQDAWIEFCFKHKDKEMVLPYLTVVLDKAVMENETPRAVKLSKMLIQLDKELIPPQVKLIQMLQTLGDLNGAADVCCALALIYERKHKFAEAAEYVEKALVLSPANAEVLEKVLAEMKHKALPPQTAPVSTIEEEAFLTVESAVPVEPSQSFKMEPHELLNESNDHAVTVAAEMTSPDVFATQMATAEQCVKQGLLKAAIEIYQQILASDSSLLEIKKKLNEVNDLYLNKWMGSKSAESAGQHLPFLLSPEQAEKKINTN